MECDHVTTNTVSPQFAPLKPIKIVIYDQATKWISIVRNLVSYYKTAKEWLKKTKRRRATFLRANVVI